MRKIHLFGLLLYWLPFIAFAQKNYTLADTAVGNQLLKEAIELANGRQFDSAYVKADSAQALFEQVLGKETKQVADVMNRKALILRYKDKLNEDVLMMQKVIALHIKLFGEEHSEVAKAYRNLGTLTYEQGKPDTASFYFQKYLNHLKKHLCIN